MFMPEKGFRKRRRWGGMAPTAGGPLKMLGDDGMEAGDSKAEAKGKKKAAVKGVEKGRKKG
jgi:hypothetical protein